MFKANVNAIDERRETALSKACREGHIDAVKELLEANADVDIQDVDGHAPGDCFKREVICWPIRMTVTFSPTTVSIVLQRQVARNGLKATNWTCIRVFNAGPRRR